MRKKYLKEMKTVNRILLRESSEEEVKKEVANSVKVIETELRKIKKIVKAEEPEGFKFVLRGMGKVQDILDDILY